MFHTNIFILTTDLRYLAHGECLSEALYMYLCMCLCTGTCKDMYLSILSIEMMWENIKIYVTEKECVCVRACLHTVKQASFI